MTKAVVPVPFVTYPEEYEFPLTLYELFDDLGIFDPVEDFTFTGRVDLGLKEKNKEKRAETLRLRREFQRRLKKVIGNSASRRRLLSWFKRNGWNVSFFVDFF